MLLSIGGVCRRHTHTHIIVNVASLFVHYSEILVLVVVVVVAIIAGETKEWRRTWHGLN